MDSQINEHNNINNGSNHLFWCRESKANVTLKVELLFPSMLAPYWQNLSLFIRIQGVTEIYIVIVEHFVSDYISGQTVYPDFKIVCQCVKVSTFYKSPYFTPYIIFCHTLKAKLREENPKRYIDRRDRKIERKSTFN